MAAPAVRRRPRAARPRCRRLATTALGQARIRTRRSIRVPSLAELGGGALRTVQRERRCLVGLGVVAAVAAPASLRGRGARRAALGAGQDVSERARGRHGLTVHRATRSTTDRRDDPAGRLARRRRPKYANSPRQRNAYGGRVCRSKPGFVRRIAGFDVNSRGWTKNIAQFAGHLRRLVVGAVHA